MSNSNRGNGMPRQWRQNNRPYSSATYRPRGGYKRGGASKDDNQVNRRDNEELSLNNLNLESVEDLLNKLDDPKYLESLQDESSIIDVLKKLSPYGYSAKPDDASSTILSLLPVREDYNKRFMFTAMIDYLYSEAAQNEDRQVIEEFLDSMFQFNPNTHVRSAYVANPTDTSRQPISTNAAEFANKFPNTVRRGEAEIFTEVSDEFAHIKPGNQDASLEHIPPEDTYYKFNSFVTLNYEKLREYTNEIAKRPELESSIYVYGAFNSEQEANQFRQQQKQATGVDVLHIQNNKWCVTGEFTTDSKKSVDYVEQNVLKSILDKNIEDRRIMTDLLRKRIYKAKKRNIAEYGKESEEFRKFVRKNNTSRDMGAINAVTEEAEIEYYDAEGNATRQKLYDMFVEKKPDQNDEYFTATEEKSQELEEKSQSEDLENYVEVNVDETKESN